MNKAILFMIKHTALDSNSYFIDIGLGLGKPNFHVACLPGVRVSFGLELYPSRYLLSLKNHCEFCGDGGVDGRFVTKCCVFTQGDIQQAKLFDPFTHIFMLSAVDFYTNCGRIYLPYLTEIQQLDSLYISWNHSIYSKVHEEIS